MKKISLTIITLFLSLIAIGQNLTEKELLGEWEPVSSTNITGDSGHNALAKDFEETVFEFKADHTMNVQSLRGSFLITMYMAAANKGKWQINATSKLIEVRDGSRENALLAIKAYKENEKIFFIIDEGIKIEVKKV